MKRQEHKFNVFWTSRLTDVEAWSSNWLHAPQPRHSHDFFQISLTRQGNGQVCRTGHSAVCPVGHFVAFQPDEVHELHPAGDEAWVFDTLYLPTSCVTAAVEELTGSNRRPCFAPTPFIDAELQARFASLHHAVVRGADSLTQADCVLEFLQHLLVHPNASNVIPASPGWRQHATGLERVRDYLEAHVESSVSLSELASIAGVGPFHLTRLFRQRYGLPPHAYHIQTRIRQARHLLKQGVSLTDVAARTGFADQSHLTRLFKKLVGVTPGDFQVRSRSFKTGETVEG